MELRSPCAVRVKIPAERLERQPNRLLINLLPINRLRRVAVVNGREVNAKPILVRRHKLHLGESRIK